MATMMMRKPEQ